jgi:hypothetical protein
MAKTSITRKSIEAGIDADRRQTREKNLENEKSVIDAETESRTLESLEGGTEDGYREIVEKLDQARDISSNEFEAGTEQLEAAHGEIEQHRDVIHEGLERAESDRENIGSAASELNSESAAASLESAMESVQNEMEHLKESIREEQEIEQDSSELNREHLGRLTRALGGG